MAASRFNITFSILNGLSSVLGNFAHFCRFGALNSNTKRISYKVVTLTMNFVDVQLFSPVQYAHVYHLSLVTQPVAVAIFQ